MPEIFGIQKLFSDLPRKRLGVFRKLGTFQLGFSNLGDDDIIFKHEKLGDIILTGIYRTDNVKGYTTYYREPYYIPKNPRTAKQQAQRQKYAAGVAAWQNLTNEQKAIYNKRAKGRRYSGYHLFLKEYLLSN